MYDSDNLTNREKQAYELARRAHEGQFDKAGKPYITHPMKVAEGVHTEDERIVAFLHDTVEDTDVTVDEIRHRFGDKIADAVELMTHPDGMSYMDYVERLSHNPIARAVKLSDLSHNMDMTRIPNPTDKDFARLEKYKKAKALLLSIEEESRKED